MSNSATELIGQRVEYLSIPFQTVIAGWIIDVMVSPLTGKTRVLVSDRPGDDPTVDGYWLDLQHLRFQE